MNIPGRIFLCGFMGAGKTTLGRKLADKIDRPFLDLDGRIIEKAGQSIPEIFEDGGERRFRTIERKTLLEVVREYSGVVALGGGSLQDQHLLDHLQLHGLLIFVETSIAVILDRITKNANRPLLLDEYGQTKDRAILEKELKILYQERLPLYDQAAIRLKAEAGSSPCQQVEILVKKICHHVA